MLADNLGKLIFADTGLDHGFDAFRRVEQINAFLGQFVCNKNFNHF